MLKNIFREVFWIQEEWFDNWEKYRTTEQNYIDKINSFEIKSFLDQELGSWGDEEKTKISISFLDNTRNKLIEAWIDWNFALDLFLESIYIEAYNDMCDKLEKESLKRVISLLERKVDEVIPFIKDFSKEMGPGNIDIFQRYLKKIVS